MKKRLVALFIFIPVIALLFIGASNDVFFKITKSFDILGEVFKEINSQYVEEVDPEDLMKDAIDGMLSNLDPYTVYMDAEESSDLDLITDGIYNGLGFTVTVKDEMLTITEIMDGYPAQKSGLRIGDRLYKIDTSLTLNLDASNIRKFTKKPAGTKLDFWILRDGRDDTLHYELIVEEINMKNVTFSEIIKDSIGYIKLERFSRNSNSEVSEALKRLKRSEKVKAVILDLRDNPGGLMEGALRIVELFVPKNSLILTTRGKQKVLEREYRSISEPLEPNLPLAVLINNGSASASEILAGAIQDLDRGIIVGEKSYGKGLVQTIFSLPYDAALKITTSKYYTPSGRSIQKINYSKTNEKKHDTLIFYTKNGRKVQELNGISPDSTVQLIAPPSFIKQLIEDDIFFKFANLYTSKLDNLPEKFMINKKIISEFKAYLNDINYFEMTSAFLRMDDLMEKLDSEKLNGDLKNKLRKIQKDIKEEEKKLIDKHSDEIAKYIEIEILKRFKSQKEMIRIALNKDNQVNTAINLLQPKNYRKTIALDIKNEK